MTYCKRGRSIVVWIPLILSILASCPARADEEAQRTCYAKFTCTQTTGTMISYRIPGTGTTEQEAYSRATQMAQQARNYCIMSGGTASPIVQDGCDPASMAAVPGPNGISPTASVRNGAVISNWVCLEHRCDTKDGSELAFVSFGPREGIDALSASVWNSLAVDAAAKGGIVPGSASTRVDDMFRYYVYQTVRSLRAADMIHRELTIEGKGGTDDDARKALELATENTIVHLSILGETATEIGPPRQVLLLNIGSCSSVTSQAVCRCQTSDGWTVITTDYSTTTEQAFERASAVATTIANDKYSGVTNPPEQIESREQP